MHKPHYEESCINCKFWEERKRSNKNSPLSMREGTCKGKYKGEYVTGNQYCLGFVKK